MADLRQAQRRMFTAFGVFAMLALAAIVFLLSPWGRSRAAYEAEYTRLRPELHKALAESKDAQNIEQKLVTAQKQIAAMYQDRFADRWSAIAAEIGELADQSGVSMAQLRYEAKPADAPGLERVEMQASVTGSYLEIMKFINALERDQMMLVVDSITLGAEREGAVELELALHTYMRQS